MYAREYRVLLRHYLEQGLSKTAIARTLHVSRRTVYHWIDTGQLDRERDGGPVQYTPRPPPAFQSPHRYHMLRDTVVIVALSSGSNRAYCPIFELL